MGITPSIVCDTIRFGPDLVECVQTQNDSCVIVPFNRIIRVDWQGGYNKAFETAHNEFFQKVNNELNNIVSNADSTGDDTAYG